jgi:hypothetical protein
VLVTAGHESFMAVFAVFVLRMAGNAGTPSGRTMVEPTTLSPAEFFPVIVTVYITPFTKLSNAHDVVVVVHVSPPGSATATYVIPTPSTAGFTHSTVGFPVAPASNNLMSTGCARKFGVPFTEATPDVPEGFRPITDTVYSKPLVSPVMLQLVVVDSQLFPPG